MEDKRFKIFVLGYVINLLIIVLMVIILIISSQGIIPEVFQKIGLLIIIADVIWFGAFSKKYKNG